MRLNKLKTIGILLIFLVSIAVPYVSAGNDEENVESNVSTNGEVKIKGISNRPNPFVMPSPVKFDAQKKPTKLKAEMLKFREIARDKFERYQNLSEENQEKVRHMTRAQIKRFAEFKHEQLKEQLKHMRVVHTTKMEAFKTRVLNQSQKQKHEVEYKVASKAYMISKSNLSEFKAKILQQQCDESDRECIKKRTEFARKSFERLADMILASIDKIKAKIEASEHLNETEINETLTALDEIAVDVEKVKVEIKSAETKDEVREVGKNLVNLWKKVKPRFNYHINKYEVKRMGLIVKQSDFLESKLDRILENAEDNEENITNINDFLNDFSYEIQSARENIAAANEILENIRIESLDNLSVKEREAIKEMHDKTKDYQEAAKENLKKAREILVKIFKALNKENIDIDVDDDEVIVVEQDNDNEDKKAKNECEDEYDDCTEKCKEEQQECWDENNSYDNCENEYNKCTIECEDKQEECLK